MRYMIIVNFDKMTNVEKQWQDYSVHIIDTEYPFLLWKKLFLKTTINSDTQ